MAQIYLARRRTGEACDKLVVVKRILPHLAENPEFVRMFLDEARIAARLAHPNIVEIHDLGAQDDSFFLAMEYIHGEDVRRLCKRVEAQGRVLPVPLACRIVSDACAGLDYAHKKTDPSGKPLNIVHRDVSPQNILVSFEGVVKVVDFGIAKAADQATVTRSGVLKGKYSYMSPEQAAGKRVDCRSDVFALGVVLYELLTGTRLFKRANDMQTLTAVAECLVTVPSEVSPRVPDELDVIVMKALAREPDQRYAEAAQLQSALEEWLGANHPAATSAELAAFMREVYADRLAREARTGQVIVEEEPPATGQRSALDAPQRRTGAAPGSSKEVTRADRGEPLIAPAAEAAERAPARPSRLQRTVEPRREPEGERPRVERRPPAPRHTVELRRPELEPRAAVPYAPQAPSTPSTVRRPPEGGRLWRGISALAVVVSAVGVGLLLWSFLWPELPPAKVRLETVPPGAMVVFDGKPLPNVTPLTLPPVPAGTYPLVLSREGYEELRVAVTVPATGTVTLDALKLERVGAQEAPPAVAEPAGREEPPPAAASPVRLTLEAEPTQAAIFVGGVERGRAPLVLEARAGQELEVRVEAAGHRPVERRVKVGAGPEQVERLVLEPAPRPGAVAAGGGKARGEAARPAPEAPRAMVRFAVTPWAEVSCNGRKLGSTPFPDVLLPVGTYECRFHNPDLGRTLNRSIEVKASALNTVQVKF